MKIFLVTIVVLLWTQLSFAQTITTVDINAGTMSWTWTPAPGDTSTGFRMKCGTTSGNYTIITDLPLTSQTVLVKNVIKGSATYFCAVVAFNQFGETPRSNEVNFSAGVVPSGSLVLSPPK
jgi:hypothetical protein